MKTLNKIIPVLFLVIISSCEDVPDFDQGESEPVVEAFIDQGVSVDDIYLKKTVPFNSGSDIEPEPINDAIITISNNGQDFVLSQVKNEPGRYFYEVTAVSSASTYFKMLSGNIIVEGGIL